MTYPVPEEAKYPGGYVHNCHLQLRAGEVGPLFEHREDGAFIARLDGYAVIPMEEFERLKALDENS